MPVDGIMPIFRKKQVSVRTRIPAASVVDTSLDSSFSPSKKHNQMSNGNVGLTHPTSFLKDSLGTNSCPSPKNLIRRSRLSQNLLEALRDPGTRRHFHHFLIDNDCTHLLQFWLDVDHFQSIAKTLPFNSDPQKPERLHSIQKDVHCEMQKHTLDGKEYSADGSVHSVLHIDSKMKEFPATATTSPVEDRILPSSCDAASECETIDNLVRGTLGTCKNIADDAVKIFVRYIAKDALHPIGIPDDLRDEVTRKICSEDGIVDPTSFGSVQQFVFGVLDTQYFHNFLQSVHHCRHQLDVLTNGTVCLADIMHDETSLSFFMEFMEQEGQRDLVEFWLAANNFYQHLVTQEEGYDSIQAQDDAMVLYDKYFSLQATCPLGFDDAIRFQVEQNICREGGPLPNCFEEAVRLVVNVLEKSYFCQFLGSQLYFKYLTELVNMVEASESIVERKRSGSDASSEQSVTTINTLLAMDGTQPGVQTRRLVKRFDDHDLRIDTGMFVPDTLWKRPLAGKLRIGYINGLGQFITEFEPEPDRKQSGGSRLSKAVKRLVYKDEEKTKEEVALQVARMIVQEVIGLTLGAAAAKLCNS